MTQKPGEDSAGTNKTEDRIVRAVMIAPLVVGILMLVALLLLLVPRTPAQVSITSNVMLMCFVYLPLFLCLLPVYFIVAITAFYAGKLNHYTGSKLGKLRTATRKAADSAATYGSAIGRRSMGLREKAAILNKIIGENTDDTSE